MSMLWERYLYKEILKFSAFFLAAFFCFYVAIDYSVHMQAFLRGKHLLQFIDIVIYYGFQFIRRCDLLLPLALLVSTIKILRTMSERHELLALQVGGLPLKRLLRPFLVTALFSTLLNFVVVQSLLPASLNFSSNFKDEHLKNLPKQEKRDRVRVLELKDSSKLAFQRFDRAELTFHDLFWIRSTEDIWRIKTLKLDREHPQNPPLASHVDHIRRGDDGGLHKIASYPSIRLEGLKASSYHLKSQTIPVEHFSLSKLFYSMGKNTNEDGSHKAMMRAEFAMKTTRPFLSLMAIIGIAPFCLRYSRFSTSLPLYACGIFSMIATYVAIQAGGILVQNNIVSPWLAIVFPLFLLFSFSAYRFIKL
jgi:lipopolysaccharide export system permease protein